jgi:hypothetical protein
MAEFYSATIRKSDRFCGPVLLRDLHTYDTHWATLARQHGSNNDINKIADNFRNWWKPQPLDKKGVEKAFIGFCKGLKPPT